MLAKESKDLSSECSDIGKCQGRPKLTSTSMSNKPGSKMNLIKANSNKIYWEKMSRDATIMKSNLLSEC